MSTPARVGKLYAYFLDISNLIIRRIVHEEMRLSQMGHEMYNDLVNRLASGNTERYNNTINNNNFLSRVQKELLAPESQTINVENLDFSIYVQIFLLLGGNRHRSEIKYLINSRNYLCHFAIRGCMAEEDFMMALTNMTNQFEAFNFCRDFLEDRLNFILS